MDMEKNLLLAATSMLVVASMDKPSLPIRIALAGCAAALTVDLAVEIKELLNGRNKAED